MSEKSGTISSSLKTTATHMFIKLLDNIDGSKNLILSTELIPIFDVICSFATLKAKGVDKIYKLQSTHFIAPKQQCFVIRPTLQDTKLVVNIINMDKQKGTDCQYWIIFVPKKLQICDEFLEKEGIYDYITILEFPLSLIPLDNDLFSLEQNDVYQNCFLYGDQCDIIQISKSLHHLEKFIGPIGYTYAKGKYANLVSQMLTTLKYEDSIDSKIPKQHDFVSNVILIDRDQDYASVFLSQLNYVGLLDEIFSIKCGKVEFGQEVTKSSDNSTLKHNLLNNDMIFNDIQNSTFSSVFISLKEKSKKISEKYKQRHDMSLSAMKEFVANELKDLQSEHRSLCLHLSASEIIMKRKTEINFAEQLTIEQNMIEGIESKICFNYIEDAIIRQMSPILILRLLCLYSITQGGLNNKDYRHLFKLFLQSYGHNHIVTFHNLKKLGILVENSHFSFANQITTNNLANKLTLINNQSSDSIRKFRFIVKRLNLIPQINGESYDSINPKDAGYVFGGAYIPLICRIVELLIERKSVNEEILNSLNGKFVNYPANQLRTSSQVIIVYFIGGVTYAEISALRFISRQIGIQILIATSFIINGDNFLKQLMPNV